MNAKAEFLAHVEGNPVMCATVSFYKGYDAPMVQHNLKRGYTPDDMESFLESINVMYDSGYGTQELFGIIWYADGTWADRDEYDGSEWWQDHVCPPIPEYI